MRIVPIKEIFGLESGETVPAVKGTIKNVYDQSKGTNAHGDWKLQNIVVADGTGEIKVKLADRDPIPLAWKGKQALIECNDGGKGLTGIKAKDDDYRGKVSRILSVTASAHVNLVDGQAGPPVQQAPPALQPPAQAPARTPAPSAPQQSAASQNHGNGHGSKVAQAAAERARDYYRVMEAVETMREAWATKHPQAVMTDAHFQAACSTVFIQLQRDGVINGSN